MLHRLVVLAPLLPSHQPPCQAVDAGAAHAQDSLEFAASLPRHALQHHGGHIGDKTLQLSPLLDLAPSERTVTVTGMGEQAGLTRDMLPPLLLLMASIAALRGNMDLAALLLRCPSDEIPSLARAWPNWVRV